MHPKQRIEVSWSLPPLGSHKVNVNGFLTLQLTAMQGVNKRLRGSTVIL
jgi:hypothetical protein